MRLGFALLFCIGFGGVGCSAFSAPPAAPAPATKEPGPLSSKGSPKIAVPQKPLIESAKEAVPPSRPPTQRRVAITIDDLPVATKGRYSAQERREIVDTFCAVLREHKAPAVGFFNMGHARALKPLVERWKACGVTFGNHTWSHPHLRKVGLSAYLKDLVRGHRAIAPYVAPGEPIFFRYPFLYEGFSPRERDAIREELVRLQSTIAPVTIDTSDWLYATGYHDALNHKDTDAAERYHRSWRWDLEESTQKAEWLSQELFGREPPQILLLHGNLLSARYLDEYLDWLEGRGYRIVSLAEALSDPAYKEVDRSTSPTGDSHWLRLRRSRSLPETSPVLDGDVP